MILEIQEFLKNFLSNSAIITNTIIFSSFLFFLLFAFLSFLKSFQTTNGDLVKKWGGCLLVLILALCSNNPWVYGIAIFILAAIFTKLEFLENLAAIFMKHQGFWKYREKQIPPATDEEVESKIKQEIEASVADEIQAKLSRTSKETEVSETNKEMKFIDIDKIKIDVTVTSRLKDMMEYEKGIISKLRKEKNLFEHFYIFENRTIVVDGVAHTLDAMISPYDIPSKWLYVVEIKKSGLKSIPHRWIQQIQGGMFALKRYFEGDGRPAFVRGILILPSYIEKRDFCGSNIGILRYDIDRDEFINKQIIFNWIHEE